MDGTLEYETSSPRLCNSSCDCATSSELSTLVVQQPIFSIDAMAGSLSLVSTPRGSFTSLHSRIGVCSFLLKGSRSKTSPNGNTGVYLAVNIISIDIYHEQDIRT
jgi:hypothetical protein